MHISVLFILHCQHSIARRHISHSARSGALTEIFCAKSGAHEGAELPAVAAGDAQVGVQVDDLEGGAAQRPGRLQRLRQLRQRQLW